MDILSIPTYINFIFNAMHKYDNIIYKMPVNAVHYLWRLMQNIMSLKEDKNDSMYCISNNRYVLHFPGA